MPATYRLTVAQQRLTEAMAGPSGMAVGWVNKVTNSVRNRAVLYCPVDTGRLRASIVAVKAVSAGAVVTGLVGTDVQYAAAVHNGSRQHVIVPKRAKVLRFVPKGGGPAVFARSVTMPKREGRPFLTRALNEELVARGVTRL